MTPNVTLPEQIISPVYSIIFEPTAYLTTPHYNAHLNVTQHEQYPSSSLNLFNPQASGLGIDNSTVSAVQAKNSEVLIHFSL